MANLRVFLIEEQTWGTNLHVVRAEDESAAIRLAFPHDGSFKRTLEVTELAPDGTPAILYSYEDSPDTPRDD
jgi:hypothetical protein